MQINIYYECFWKTEAQKMALCAVFPVPVPKFLVPVQNEKEFLFLSIIHPYPLDKAIVYWLYISITC